MTMSDWDREPGVEDDLLADPLLDDEEGAPDADLFDGDGDDRYDE
jgi:hypothetical protein